MKTVYCIIVLFIFSVTLYASGIDSTLLRAERFYQQNEFSKAIVEYQSLADSGKASAA